MIPQPILNRSKPSMADYLPRSGEHEKAFHLSSAAHFWLELAIRVRWRHLRAC